MRAGLRKAFVQAHPHLVDYCQRLHSLVMR